MEAAGDFIATVVELAAGVEDGEGDFDGGFFQFWVGVHWDTAAVIGDGDGAIDIDFDGDSGTVTGEGFIDGVIDDFVDAVMEAALEGIADIHSGAFSDGFEAFEDLDFGAVVLGSGGWVLGWGWGGVRHGRAPVKRELWEGSTGGKKGNGKARVEVWGGKSHCGRRGRRS